MSDNDIDKEIIENMKLAGELADKIEIGIKNLRETILAEKEKYQSP